MMKHMNELKAAATFTGAPDPLRGMEPYKALHDQAKNTIEQVAARVNGGSRKPQNGLFNQIPRGPSAAPIARGAHLVGPKPPQGAGGAAAVQRSMAGMGGGSAQQPQNANNWQNKAQNLGKPVLNQFTPRGTVQPPGGVTPGQTTSTPKSSTNSGYIPKTVQPRGGLRVTKPAGPTNDYKPPVGGGGGGGFTINQRTVNSGKANTDGTYERGLVNELCAPGGMKPVPPADKLEIFVRNCRNIPADIIAPLLLAKLSEDSYQVQLKALCVVEALCKQEGCEDYLEYFKENQEEIAELGIKGNKAVAKKADSVIVLIERGGEDEPEEEEEPDQPPPPPRRTAPVQQQQVAAEPEPEVDLMAMAGDDGGDGGGDLFNIMPTETEAPPAPEVEAENMFDGLTTEVVNKSVIDNFNFDQIPPTNVPTANPSGDVFGDIDFGGATSMTMNAAPTTTTSSHTNVMSSDTGGGADAFSYFENVKPAAGPGRGRSRGSSAGIDMNAIPSYNPGGMSGYNMPPGGGMMNPGGMAPPPNRYGMNPGMPPQGYNMPPQNQYNPGMPPPNQYNMNLGMNPGMNPGMGYPGMPLQPGMNYGMPPQGMNYGMQQQGMMGVPPPQQQKPKPPDQFANLLGDF